jgi:uncharacterized protein YacL (UPF0231 family)
MRRLHLHWTGGTHDANDLDRAHYHFLVEGDGKVIRGDQPVTANQAPIRGAYAAHTLRANAGAIAISACCMGGAVQGGTHGKWPLNRIQAHALAEAAAQICDRYGIPVTEKTVLCHGEVERQLGIKQRNKWDPCVLPWAPHLSMSQVCDWWRSEIRRELEKLQAVDVSDEPAEVPIKIVAAGREFDGFLEDGAAWAPARDVVEALGKKLDAYDSAKPSVTVLGTEVKCQIQAGRMFAKARSLATVLNVPLRWDAAARKAVLG